MVDVSIRGLQESGQRSGYPLVRFSGTLDGYYDEEDNFSNTQVHFQFSDLDVEEAAEPYPFPVTELSIKFSNYKHSSWGIFSESLAKCLGDDEDLPDVVGHSMVMAYTPNHELPFKDKNWQPDVDDDGNAINESDRPNVIIDAWEVISVDGVSAEAAGVDPMDVLGRLLDGKNRAGFNKAALTDPIIKAQGKDFITAQITKKGFITEALSNGLFEEDEDSIFHAVA